MSPTELLVWGFIAHLIADWLLQNEWMAANKMKRRERRRTTEAGWTAELLVPWWDRHPAAYVHSGIHGIALAFVFGWVAIPLAISHLLIDTRKPVEWWSKMIRQTQPDPKTPPPVMSIGLDVRIWVDQVFHIVAIAIAALAVG